jgi:hypothetical protein
MKDLDKYSESEKEAMAWIEQTDIDQFSLMELLIMYDARERVKNEHIQDVSNFRFSGMNKGEKFIVNVKAVDRETAIAIFESENPDLKWTTTSNSVLESNLCKCTWPSCRYASNCRNNRQAP